MIEMIGDGRIRLAAEIAFAAAPEEKSVSCDVARICAWQAWQRPTLPSLET